MPTEDPRPDNADGSSYDDVGSVVMGDSEGSYVYVDDEGKVVPPEEETSWLMAMGVGGHGQASNMSRAVSSTSGDGGDPSAALAFPKRLEEAPHTQYTESPEEFERERLEAEQIFDALMAEPGLASSAPQDDFDQVSRDQAAGGVAEGTQEVEEGGTSFSREATNEEDEWVLERILDKRVTRNKGGTTTDYKEFYDDFGGKTTGMLAPGRIEYLCKWQWYDEPTWETKEVLEDDYFKELTAFEKSIVEGRPKAPHVTQKWSDLHPGEPAADPDPNPAVKKQRPAVHEGPQRERQFGDYSILARITHFSLVSQIMKLMSYGLGLYGYGCCATDDQMDAFLATYKKHHKTHRPILLYHGTQLTNNASICRNGFRVPRTSTDVAHGSAYGVGIYAAFEPHTAFCFCKATLRGNGRILCCVALVSPDDPSITMVEDYCVVFQNPRFILPVWAFDVNSHGFSCPLSRRYFTYETLGRLHPPPFQPAEALDVTRAPPIKLTEAKAKALTKVHNKNILNINRLAEKVVRETL